MSIEEIINELDGLRFILERKRDREMAETGVFRACSSRLVAINAAIALLRTHQDAQPNEPLTLDELREMDGQPIYVVDRVYTPNSGWWIIGWTKDGCVLTAAKRRGTQYIVQNYGIDWVAYRRPPKEA